MVFILNLFEHAFIAVATGTSKRECKNKTNSESFTNILIKCGNFVSYSEENTSKSSTEVIQTMSSRTVVTRTVVSETLEDGRVVSSETTTTTVTGGDASGAAEPATLSSTGNLIDVTFTT